MSRERVVSGKAISADEEKWNKSLRPEKLEDFTGQKPLVEKLSISLQAARKRNEPVEHILFYGPPGLGKTTLAHIIAKETSANIFATSGPSLTNSKDLIGILTNLQKGDILFIDEIHRLPPVVEEFLYPALEDFKIDFVVDKGAFAKTLNLPLKQFTLVGATTRAGALSAPLRERFGLSYVLDFYQSEDLVKIVRRSAGLLSIDCEADALKEIAGRARGTPRVANRLLRRVRDFAEVKLAGRITAEAAHKSLELEGIDANGLDDLDRRYLEIIISHYNCGPAGLEAVAASMNEDSETLEEMVEPYLLKIGAVQRTPRGRKVNVAKIKELNISLSVPLPVQNDLFT